MNDEFNNQNNINEVNNNFSNQGNNEVELNLNNNKKNNNFIIPVIIMFIVLILFVFVFLGNKNNLFRNNNKPEQNNGLIDNNDSNKDNLQEEDINDKDNQTNDKADEENIIPEKDYAKLEQKVLDEYYLRDTNTVDEHILQWKYSAIANGEISYSDFRKNYVVKNIIDSLEPISSVGGNVSHIKDEYDKNGVKYPDYCNGNIESRCIENIAKDFGLTVEEINKMDKSVWNITGGQYSFKMYDAKEVKDKFLNIYNDIFKSSFSIYLSNEIYGVGYYFSYDKNIDKIITGGHGGTAGFDKRVILETKEENNLYKIVFVEGHFSPGGKWMSLDIDSNEDISDSDKASDVVKRNKNELPNYEIIFEETNTGYRYKNIKKIENNSANVKINYEIKVNGTNKELYANNKKVNGIQADNELGNLEVKEFKDLLIVDEQNPGPSRRLFVVDKNGNSTEIDYKVSTYNHEFISYIDSYRTEENNLYIKVNRQWGNGYLDWYCRYDDKNEVAEYEVKYEYVNGNLDNRQVINEITINEKYKNEKCN